MFNFDISRKITKANNPIFPFNIERLLGETDEEYEAFCKGFKNCYDLQKAEVFEGIDTDYDCGHSELDHNEYECEEDEHFDGDTCPCYEQGFQDGIEVSKDNLFGSVLLNAFHLAHLRNLKWHLISLVNKDSIEKSEKINGIIDAVDEVIHNYVMNEVWKQLDEKDIH